MLVDPTCCSMAKKKTTKGREEASGRLVQHGGHHFRLSSSLWGCGWVARQGVGSREQVFFIEKVTLEREH